jgi:hypothetical protein
MAYTRCTDCGAKALRIATRCPSCGTSFPLRDENGDRIRHRRCGGCDIYVPRNPATCPWCGTEGRDLPWKPAAAAAVALLLLGSGSVFFLTRDAAPGGPPGSPGVESALGTSPSLPSAIAPLRPGGVGAGHPEDPTAEGAPGDDPRGQALARGPQGDGSEVRGEALARADAPAATGAAGNRGELAPGDGDWAPAEAVTFVNVRAEPTREAPVLGVVPEQASVLLGDLRGGWRRIRAGDLSGWVDGRLFRMASSGE